MAEEELRAGEEAAAKGGEADFSSGHKTNVTGVVAAAKGGKLKSLSIKTFGVIVAVIALVLLFVTPIYAIDAISTRLIEETDVQYADAVQSKALVFQNALENGEIPENTFERLQQEGVEVGYMDGDNFVASRFGQTVIAANNSSDAEIIYKQCTENCTALSIKLDDGTVIPASQFYYEVNHNVKLYNAFNNSTYSRAAYYYDEEAQRVFKEIGTNRNNFGSDESLEDIIDGIMGTGHNFGLDSQTWHYMPYWTLSDPEDPSSIVLSYWSKVKDPFTCQGSSGNNQIAYWNDPVVHGPFPKYNSKGEIVGYYYTVSSEPVYGDYGCISNASDSFVRTVSQSNMNLSADYTQTTLNTVDTLKVADTATKEKRSMLLYAGIAESFSRTKAGYGSTGGDTNSILAAVATIGATAGGGADVNDVMNWLYDTRTTTIFDTESRQYVTTTGSALESPSLYAVLTGEKVEASELKNYSSDRVAKLAEGIMGRSEIGKNTMGRTITTSSNSGSVKVGRCTEDDGVSCDSNSALSADIATSKYNIELPCNPGDSYSSCLSGRTYNNGEINVSDVATDTAKIVDYSMYNNSFSDIQGVNAGEMLVEGAVNLGRALAKASGSSGGDKQAVDDYLAVTANVLAMDAAADRLNRSPLDITSKNTFLGSIVYKFAISTMKSGSLLNKVASTSRVLASAAKALLPSASAADDEEDLYLAVHGNCETLGNIGAVGSATCSESATFDTSTYQDPYGKLSGDWLSANVECNSDNICTPKESSSLAKYIAFNELRETPLGTTDGAILQSVWEMQESQKGIIAKFLGILANLFGINKKVKTMDFDSLPTEATGEAFVIGSDDWNDYKLAQRYISLARAAETLRQYDGDETAYNFSGFGLGNPIARYINEHSEDVFAISE